ncbi:YggS family pyridoxal phosphate-dependent enzyme [Curvivirga aplysinae]|uniref:YggS family pyridoxal phosphate-dependent enzyme n=1 Tax=Curvivirga aplysinae TaxID=2529852 RepID=UPI0012BB9B5B|nr:YggS family pyridoxal phosphate-dependent enzyme [Curvivirga aplysinae]MTI09316.1 YggS family pyridoxal phosphate-dependent enzyme [Curvivirga aplysinae]
MLSENLQVVKTNIVKALEEAPRKDKNVTLVAVGKTYDADVMRQALTAGQRVFGENRVQEAAGKWPELVEEYSDIELHLIGPLQTNKVKQALELFDVFQTIDRLKLAKSLAKELEKTPKDIRCFIQVNTGNEPQKAGILPDEADDFIKTCREDLNLPIVGLMCIPPVDEEAGLHFAYLKKIADRNGLNELSMGMSGDYEAAIGFGATHVRVGSAIFGKREYA